MLTAVLLGVAFVIFWTVDGRPVPNPDHESMLWLEPLVTMVAYGVAGALLIDRRPDLPFGWLLSVAAVLVAAQVVLVSAGYAAALHGDRGGGARWALTAAAFGFAPIAVQGLINIRFPNGRPANRWGTVLEWMIIAGTALVFLGGLFGNSALRDVTGERLSHPLTGGSTVGRVADALTALAPVVVLLGLVAGIGVVVGCVRASGIQRQQLKWRAVGVLVALALYPLAITGRLPSITNSLDAVVFVATLVVPVMRYRLWAIDTILRRSMVYGATTATVIVAFAGLSALAATIVSRQVAVPVAAVLVAVSFVPLRDRTQRLVDRLFYGGRQDPHRTLRELGRQLNTVPGGDALATFGHAVATALKLPHVAITRADGVAIATYGGPAGPTRQWPLTYDGQIEGYLLASTRRGEDRFDLRDDALLTDIARQLGMALHTRTLTSELLASRQQIVTAREEERRRLRRELHDGLGPVLTAIGLNLDAAHANLPAGDTNAGRHLVEAKQATAQALRDLRRVVHGLRPPVLDDLGLAGALRSQATRLAADTRLHVAVDADGLPDLPAAVEVAAYRIAVEALTNVARHSRARHCQVNLEVAAGQLLLRVSDDGTSAGPWAPGVGITAMRERVAELGGTCHAGPGPTGGTITARLPLPETP